MRFVLVVAACGLMLGGCKTAAERQQAVALDDQATCARLGAAPGSEREFQCKLTLETQRRNESAAYGAAQDAANQAVAAQQRQQFTNRMIFGPNGR